jgi:hypothetical protein
LYLTFSALVSLEAIGSLHYNRVCATILQALQFVVENSTPARHPREGGGPALFDQGAQGKLGSCLCGNDGW